jgi:hypothetical protein
VLGGIRNLEETVNEFKNYPIKNSGCIVASDHRAVKRGSTPRVASLLFLCTHQPAQAGSEGNPHLQELFENETWEVEDG